MAKGYKSVWVILALWGFVGILSPSVAGKQPNILLIFSDELAPEYLSCYGGSYPTPTLERLAAQGLRFTKAYTAASMCTPSRFAVLTGKYAGRCRDPKFLKSFPPSQPYSIAWNTYLSPDVPIIARLLNQHGYLTGMVGKCHVAQVPSGVALPKFAADADLSDSAVDKKLRERHALFVEQLKKQAGFQYANSIAWDNLDRHPIKALRHHNFPWMTRGAVEFLKLAKQKQEPFFLYVATTAVHGPAHVDEFNHDLRYTPQGRLDDVRQYEIPPMQIQKALQGAKPWWRHRVAGLTSLDFRVKWLLQTLGDLDLEQETLVIFMADHNIEPGKATCYEKGYVVPTLMRWPGRIKPGTVTSSLMQSVDILPTALAAAGVPMPTGTFDGVSLLPIFQDPQASVRKTVYFESGYARAISDGRYKYIALRYPTKVIDKMNKRGAEFAVNYLDTPKQSHSQIAITHYPYYFDADQLYDLARDPYEQKNVYGQASYQRATDRLRQALSEQLESFDHPYDLRDIPFLNSDRYREMADNTRAIGTDFIKWLPRDHGRIVWPPTTD